MKPTFLAVGHLCLDVVEGGYLPGGAATYSSLTARELGAEPHVLTAFGEEFLPYRSFLEGVQVHAIPSPTTTVFHNRYRAGHREQHLLSVGAPIKAEAIAPEWCRANVIYLCPIADEVRSDVLNVLEGELFGATPQGWLRAWDESGRVRPKRWETAEEILPHLEALILSNEDIAAFPDELERYRARCRRVVLTCGREGAILFEGGRARQFPAYPTQEVDPTGAGDVFATAFLIHLWRTGDAEEAVRFGNCVASFAVEALGPHGIPTAERIAERWAEYQRRF